MKVKAIKSFSGKIAMFKGEEKEVESDIAKEYIGCGYLEEIEEEKAVKPKESQRNKGKKPVSTD